MLHNFYLATIIHKEKPINVGFSIKFDRQERNPQAKVLAAARFALVETLTKQSERTYDVPDPESLNFQNITVVLSVPTE